MKQEGWDRLGISVSGVCLVHCLLLPILISALPMWSSAQQVHGWMHPVFAILLVPTTILALVRGYRRHRSSKVVTLMTIGLLLVLIAAFPALHYPGVVFETVMTMSGSLFLISGHFLNWRLARQCKVDMSKRAGGEGGGHGVDSVEGEFEDAGLVSAPTISPVQPPRRVAGKAVSSHVKVVSVAIDSSDVTNAAT